MVGAVYGERDELFLEGSGGPSREEVVKGGGDGGGVIHADVEGEFILLGTMSATGGDARNNSSSGGGSGGSIQIVTSSLRGNGTIDVKGGKGAALNSGGGSGGRVSIKFRKSEDSAMYPNMTKFWGGRIIVEGGEGSSYGGYGSDGTLFTTE